MLSGATSAEDVSDMSRDMSRGETQRSRNQARFAEIYAAQYDDLWKYAIRRCAHYDAKAVVSDTFLVAWRRIDDVPSGDAARLWLFVVARNCIANHVRQQRRRLRLISKLADATAAAASEEPAHLELHAALGELRADDRELLRLLAWEELSHEQIATMLGVTANAVALRAQRARRRLALKLVEQRQPAASRGHVDEIEEVSDDDHR